MKEPDYTVEISFLETVTGEGRQHILNAIASDLADEPGVYRLNVKHDDDCACVCGCKSMVECTCRTVIVEVREIRMARL
jgi:hypothetical protein